MVNVVSVDVLVGKTSPFDCAIRGSWLGWSSQQPPSAKFARPRPSRICARASFDDLPIEGESQGELCSFVNINPYDYEFGETKPRRSRSKPEQDRPPQKSRSPSRYGRAPLSSISGARSREGHVKEEGRHTGHSRDKTSFGHQATKGRFSNHSKSSSAPRRSSARPRSWSGEDNAHSHGQFQVHNPAIEELLLQRVAERGAAPVRSEVTEGHARILNRRIVSTRNAAEILDLFEQLRDQFTVVNTCTAFHRVAKFGFWLPRHVQAQLLADRRLALLVHDLEGMVPECNAQALSNIAWAHGKFGHGSHALMLKLGQAVVSGQYRQFGAQELCSTLWSFAKIGNPCPQVFTMLADEVIAKLPSFKPTFLSSVAWSYARVGHVHPPLLHALAVEARATLQRFTPQSLSNIVWAYAKLGYHEPELFDAVAVQSRNRLSEFIPQDLASTAWAYAKARHPAPELFAGLAVACERTIAGFSPQALSNTAWAFATVSHRSESLFDAMASHCISILGFCSPQAVANIAWAFASMGHAAPHMFEAIANDASPRLASFSPQAIACSAFAFAMLNHGHAGLFASLAEQVSRRLDEFNAQGLANVAWALVVSDTLHPQLLARLWAHAATRKSYNVAELRQLYQVHLVLTHYAKHLSGLGGAIPGVAGGADAFLSSVWFRGFVQTEAKRAWNKGRIGGKLNGSVSQFQKNISDTLLEMGVEHELEYDTPEYSIDMAITRLPPGCASAATFTTTNSTTAAGSSSSSSSSVASASSRSSIASLSEGTGVARGSITSAGEDLQVAPGAGAAGGRATAASSGVNGTAIHGGGNGVPRSSGGTLVMPIAIEADGPAHFAYNTLDPLGPTVLKARLLRAMGWHVVQVPYFQWAQLRNSEEKELYLRAALSRYIDFPRGGNLRDAAGTAASLRDSQGVMMWGGHASMEVSTALGPLSVGKGGALSPPSPGVVHLQESFGLEVGRLPEGGVPGMWEMALDNDGDDEGDDEVGDEEDDKEEDEEESDDEDSEEERAAAVQLRALRSTLSATTTQRVSRRKGASKRELLLDLKLKGSKV
eukprot:jgi/Mesvir1/28969/Mv17744-RA.1